MDSIYATDEKYQFIPSSASCTEYIDTDLISVSDGLPESLKCVIQTKVEDVVKDWVQMEKLKQMAVSKKMLRKKVLQFRQSKKELFEERQNNREGLQSAMQKWKDISNKEFTNLIDVMKYVGISREELNILIQCSKCKKTFPRGLRVKTKEEMISIYNLSPETTWTVHGKHLLMNDRLVLDKRIEKLVCFRCAFLQMYKSMSDARNEFKSALEADVSTSKRFEMMKNSCMKLCVDETARASKVNSDSITMKKSKKRDIEECFEEQVCTKETQQLLKESAKLLRRDKENMNKKTLEIIKHTNNVRENIITIKGTLAANTARLENCVNACTRVINIYQ